MNLHKLADAALDNIQPNEDVVIRYSLGHVTNKGVVTSLYSDPHSARARWQSAGGGQLTHAEKANDNNVSMRIYLYAAQGVYANGINRPLGKSGDFICRLRDDTWWLVTGLIDDFSAQGWVSVRATLQVPDKSFL